MVNDDDIVVGPKQGVEVVINLLNRLVQEGGYVFRGYSKQDEMLPKIIREKDYTDLEQQLLKDFEKYGSNYFNASTPIDFMSWAQHFGLPTRLLDFTYNPFIALSFSLFKLKGVNYSDPEDRKYYYIRCASIGKNICIPSIPLKEDIYNNSITRTDSLAIKASQCIDSVNDIFGKNVLNRNISSIIGFKESREKEEFFQEKIKNRVILFIDPNQSNQRIIMQQGLFMFPYTLSLLEHKSIVRQNSFCVKIHESFRGELIKYLDTLGYNTFRLMPDLSSICEAITRKNTYERFEDSNLFKKKASNK